MSEVAESETEMFGISPRTARPTAVITLCALAIIAEGYDLIVYGALIPSLLKEPGWHLNASNAGTIGSCVYVGMLVGALASGQLSDRYGRRSVVLASVAWFAVWTIACAAAGGPWQLGLFRFLAGIGMGGVMPAVLALAKEYAPQGRTGLVITFTMAGVPIGGTIAALIGLAVIPAHGWRPMFAIGAVVSVLIFVLTLFLLPESAAFRQAQHTAQNAATAAKAGLRNLFESQWALLSMLFAAATFMNLLTWYGLNTWLTTLMRDLHYPLSSALQFSLTLNIGAIAGSFLLAWAADRWGTTKLAFIGSLIVAAALVGVTIGTGNSVFLLGLIAVMGIGAQSALNLINASVADTYPVHLRATALGWSNGVGRLGAVAAPQLGGWILSAGLGPKAVFLTFFCSAILSAAILAVIIVKTRPRAQLTATPTYAPA